MIMTRRVTTDEDRWKGGGSDGSGNRAGGSVRGGRGGRGGGSGNYKGRQQSTKSSKTAAAVIAVGKTWKPKKLPEIQLSRITE